MSVADDECPELVSAKVPVTILTGFLGSGKTTLLHYILTAEHDLKIAVLVNEFEFGKSIEKGLTVKSSSKSDDEWLELNNGCMCCTAQSQTVLALEKLMKRSGTFDLILVETSGLADPAPVAALFWQDEALCGMLYLSGIITLVDCKLICSHLEDLDVAQEAIRQIVMADRIILNKCDIASEAEVDAAAAAVQTINPTAHHLRASFSKVEHLRDILFLNTTREAPEWEHLHKGGSLCSVTAMSFEYYKQNGPFLGVSSRRDIDALCRDLLYHDGEHRFEVMRCKAAIWEHQDGNEKPRLLQLQSIGPLFDISPMEGASVPFGCNRLLVMGKRLDFGILNRIIQQHIKPASNYIPMASPSSTASTNGS